MFEAVFGAEMPLAARLFVVFLTLLLIVIGFVAVKKLLIGQSYKLVGKYVPPPPPVEIARITEHVVFSGGGAFAVVMLILFNIVLTITYFEVTNVLQQDVALLSWIGWNILWGIGAIIGRRRTYIVHRTVHRDVPPRRTTRAAPLET